jgi:hypothetical protein
MVIFTCLFLSTQSWYLHGFRDLYDSSQWVVTYQNGVARPVVSLLSECPWHLGTLWVYMTMVHAAHLDLNTEVHTLEVALKPGGRTTRIGKIPPGETGA